MSETITRRRLLGHAAAGTAAAALGGGLVGRAASATARARVIPLPSPRRVRADFQRMVDFGPRLTGNDAHLNYIAWLEGEFVSAGAQLLPCDEYAYERWSAQSFALSVAGDPVKIASYYPRSQETPAAGVSGPLVYGGAAPVPSITPGADVAALQAALAAYPGQLASWAQGLPGLLSGSRDGSILLVDLPMPFPLTSAAFLPLVQYLHWPGHTVADWALDNYKRTWIMPGLGVPLAPFQNMGAKGVVFIVDASWENLSDNYLPFDHGSEPIPALYVDREVGNQLRVLAGARPDAKLTLTATRTKVSVPSVTAILPGRSKECVILDTHTDGQGFVEENGGAALVQLARHFGSLPSRRRLERTLVFACWPGHMSGALPELQGWINAHPDLLERAAAALTVEHLGCSEWIDSPDQGFHPTGLNEMFGVWVTQGKYFELTRDALIARGSAMARTALLRPPVQFGVGGAFQSAGIPQIGAIAGPEYLLTMKANGDMDKLDAKLASSQIRWIADILRRLERVSAADLRSGDPTLGSSKPGANVAGSAACGPAA